MKTKEFQEVNERLLRDLVQMNTVERKELFVSMDISFCFKCGGEHGAMRRCSCQNQQ